MKKIQKRVIVPATEEVKASVKAPAKASTKKLPPDEYKEEIPAEEVYVDETRKIVVSVKRGGEDGLPMVDVRQFQMSEVYTGFTKKGINIPLSLLPDLIQ